jgi:hypothetical protein
MPGTPGPRRDAAFAWDPIGRYSLMFGGIGGVGGAPTGESVFGDTWIWTDSRWLALHPSTSPPARSGASLGYDPLSKRMILYGGGSNFYLQGIDPSRNDTWAWDGTTWSELFPAHVPTPSSCCSPTQMVTNAAVPALWLTLGLARTWSWTGSDWAETTPATRPPERFDFGLAYDGQLAGVVAACGYAGEGTTLPGEAAPYHDDTWLWKDGAWSELHPATKPARGPCVAAYDAARGDLVVFSGAGGTFTFDGVSWTHRHTVHVPPVESSSDASFVYDAKAGQAVLFGGSDTAQANEDLNQTWTWDGTDWSQRT